MAPDHHPTTLIDLEFLTDDERDRQLCLSYWQVDPTGKFLHTVAAIAEGFGIPSSKVSALVGQHCVAFFPEESCSNCGQRRPFRTRSEFEERQRYRRNYGRLPSGICTACQEAVRREAQRKAEELARARVAMLQEQLERLRRDYFWLAPRLLSFDDAVYLVSLFRAGGSDDLSYVVPHPAFTSPLSPTTELDRRILDQLYRREIVAIHPGSSHDALEFEDGAFRSFFPFKVHWVLPMPANGPSPARYLEDLERLLKSEDEWPDDWHEAAAELHRTIALDECLQYLRIALEEHGFDLRPSEKLTIVLRSVLARFSIGQAYNFIWRAARDVTAFYVRERISKTHAVNVVPGNIQRAAERAVAEGWTVKAFRRDRRVPESQVSHVLFTMALKHPEGGFGSVPPPPPEGEGESPGDEPPN